MALLADNAIPPAPASRGSEAAAYFNQGMTYYQQKNYSAAIENFNQALRLDSNHAPAYSKRGNARYFSGDQQGAIADYNRSLNLNPNQIQIYFNRASVR